MQTEKGPNLDKKPELSPVQRIARFLGAPEEDVKREELNGTRILRANLIAEFDRRAKKPLLPTETEEDLEELFAVAVSLGYLKEEDILECFPAGK